MPILIFLSTFTIYLFTMYPSIAPEDSGEFVTAVWTLGIPHATGYPLYILLGKITTVIVPFGSPAYRVNLLSALLGAGTITLMCYVFRCFILGKDYSDGVFGEIEETGWLKSSAWVTGMLLAGVPILWYLSLLAEVYVLNAFLAALILFVIFYRVKNDKIYLLSFIFGLAMCNHHTLILWLPGFLWLWWLTVEPPVFARPVSFEYRKLPISSTIKSIFPEWQKMLFWSIFFFILGLSVYLFLLFRSLTGPVIDTGDPDTLRRFFRVLTRADYGTFSLFRGEGGSAILGRFSSLMFYSKMILKAFTPLGIVLIAIGIYCQYKINKRYLWVILLLWVFSGPIFIILANPPSSLYFQGLIERFFVLSFLPISIFVAVAIYKIGGKINVLRPVFLLLIILSVSLHFPGVSGRGNLHARDFGINLLKSMPKGSVIYDPGDSAAYGILSQQVINKKREDVKVILYHRTLWGQDILRGKYPEIFPEKLSGFDSRFLKRLLMQLRERWIFVEVPKVLPGSRAEDKLPFKTNYPEDGLPYGIVYRYFPMSMYKLAKPVFQLPLCELPFWWFKKTASWKSDKYMHDPFTRSVVNRYSEAYSNFGQKYAQYDLHEQAKGKYMYALNLNPGLMEAHNNLGVVEYETGNYKKAAFNFENALRVDPGNAGLYHNLALSQVRMGDLNKAEVNLKKAISLNPKYITAIDELGRVLFEQNKFREAALSWERVLNYAPDKKEVHYRLAEVYERLNEINRAINNIDIYLDYIYEVNQLKFIKAKQYKRDLLLKKGMGKSAGD